MKKIIGIVIFYLCLQTINGQSISIIFNSPFVYSRLEYVSGPLPVSVSVLSSNPVTNVTANVSGRQTSLTLNPATSLYEGSILLNGLTQGNLSVQVIAYDNQGNQQIANQAFIYDIPAVLIVESPLAYSTASPLVHIKAKCVDTGGCALSVRNGLNVDFSVANTSPQNSVDTVLDMSDYVGIENFNISATDSRGQVVGTNLPVYIDTSSNLKQVFAANDLILDFNYNQLLVTNPRYGVNTGINDDNNPFLNRTRIVNIITGDSAVIPYPGTPLENPGRSLLTKYGAILCIQDSFSITSFFDWNANSLYPLGPANSATSLRVSGNNAIWSNDSVLYIRSLQTNSNSIISSLAGNDNNDLASNGLVAYWSRDYNIYRFENNTSSLLTNNSGNKWNIDPSTDGKNIVYTKLDPCCSNQSYSTYLNNGQTDTVLSNNGMRAGQYQLNSKYIAYSKPDSAGHFQIWLRDSLGISTKLTSFGDDCFIDLLGPNGDLTFTSKNSGSKSRRYFANRSTGQIADLCTAMGTTYFRGSTWYLTLGKTLYKINVTPGANNINNPFISELDSTYCQNQGRENIKILNLPDTNAGIIVTVMMDGADLPIAADTSVSFDVSTMAAGKHVVKVVYSSVNATKSQTDTFAVVAPVTPAVNLSSSMATVTSLTDPVMITAVNEEGGGTAPLYTFASDRNFATILQAEAADNTIIINPETLSNGINEIYVRMKSSETCYTVLYNTDSLQVDRNTATSGGITDPDFPNQVIIALPNPFSETVSITGLNTSKAYFIELHNVSGKIVDQQQVFNKAAVTLNESFLRTGTYWLSIYSYTRNKLIGTITVLKD